MTKEKIKEILIKYWQTIIIILMLMFSAFMFQLNESNKKELQIYKDKQELVDTYDQIEKRLEDMKQREAEYIELEKSFAKLDKVDKELEKKRKELNELKKENINAQIQKLSNDDLRLLYNSLGFPPINSK